MSDVLRYWNGNRWVPLGSRSYLSSIPPENPNLGEHWYHELGEADDLDNGDIVIGNASLFDDQKFWFDTNI